MATRPPPNLHDIFINRPAQTQSDVAYSNLLDDRDPAAARQARVVGRDVGLPGATVEADLPGFKQEADNNRNLDLLSSDPSMARFLVDPHNAAAVKDDLPALSEISAAFKLADQPGGDPSGRAFLNYMKRTRLGQGKGRLLSALGVSAAPQAYSFGREATPPQFFETPVPTIPRRVTLPEWMQGISSSLFANVESSGMGLALAAADIAGKAGAVQKSDAYQSLKAQMEQDQATAQYVSDLNPTWIGKQAYGASESLAAMGAAILTRKPLMAISLQAGGQEYQQVRERGGSANEALAASTVTGAAEGLFERYFGLGWMLGNVGKAVEKKAMGHFVSGLLLREVPSEVATTGVQDLADALVAGGEGWASYVKRHEALSKDNPLIQTAVQTALMVGLAGGPALVAQHLSPERRAIGDIEQSTAGAEFLDRLMSAAEKSKVKKEDPETLRDFVDQRTQDSPVRNVYVPVEAAVAYMQSDQYKGELDPYKEQIAQAQATQGDIVIPIGDAVAHLSGTDAWTALKDQVRVQPGGLSRSEALAKHAEIIDKLEQRGKEIAVAAGEADVARTGATEVYTDVKNRLRVAGIDERQAENVAQLYAARYEARAARRGGTPMEQFQRSKIVFPGEKPGDVLGRKFAQGATVNIGLNVNDGSKITPEEAVAALKAQGVEITRQQVRQSATEPTLVARLSKPLTAKQGHAVSTALRQEAIAQQTGGKGALYGPLAAKWGPFNPDFFLTFNKLALEARVPQQDVLPEAGWTQERVSGLIDQFGNEDGSSSAIAVMMSPDEFLGLTASAAGREALAERVATLPEYGGKLDVERLQASGPITLTVALGGENDTRPPPMIRGHEGRHRMSMLKAAGVARVPVVVQLTDKDGKTFSTAKPMRVANILANRSRSDQLANGDLTGEINGVPISFRYQDRLADMGERVLFQAPQAPFYSALERAIASSPQVKASAEQWIATLRKTPGVKQEELEWSGLLDFLAMNTEQITRDQLSELLIEGGVQTEEVVFGGDDLSIHQRDDESFEVQMPNGQSRGVFKSWEDAQSFIDIARRHPNTQFSSWTSDPSNQTYRELLITLPQGVRGNPARAPSTHWDVEGVVAHARFMDKTDADGKRVLFIEEVQSDWHQKGRDQGYELRGEELQKRIEEQRGKLGQARARLDKAEIGVIEKAPEVFAKWREAAIPEGIQLSETGEQRKLVYEQLLKRIDDWRKVVDHADRVAARQGGLIPSQDELLRDVQNHLANDIMRFVNNVAFEPLMRDELQAFRDAGLAVNEASQAYRNANTGIPNAPFKSSWPALVMKRMIRWASDHGYDKVAWTTGEEQANRYNLSAQVGSLGIRPTRQRKIVIGRERSGLRSGTVEADNYEVDIAEDRARQVIRQNYDLQYGVGNTVRMNAEQVREVFGADLGGRMLVAADTSATDATIEGEAPFANFSGLDLKIGGEGMRGFYDRNLVNITNDIIKKYGAKVDKVEIVGSDSDRAKAQRFRERLEHITDPVQLARVEAAIRHDEGEPHPGFEITDKLREAASGGFPLFQDRGEGPRGTTILANDGERIIHLFATANRSTMLHETGHIWLEELRDDATAKDAIDQDKADWATVSKWFAANGAPLAGKGKFIPTAAHEMWARGVERYLMEGKSPTLGLRSVFKTFRAWLVRIYGVVQNLQTPITPEIREVMDRLIATQEAIDDAARNNATEPLFKSAQDAGMTDAEFADYQQRIADARDEAYDTLLYKTMEAIRRQRTQETRDQRSAIRAEVGEQISRQPQFKLLHLLRTGKWLGEPDRPAVDVKLNTGWLLDNYGQDILDKLPRGLPITKGNGADGDTVAEMVGLGSGAEVVHTLLGMRAAADALRARGETRSMRDVLVAEEVDRVMAERHGDTLDDGSIEEEAIAALNTARQGEIIASEARQLAKRKAVLGTPTPYQFAREWAKRTVAAGHVRDVASRSALQRYIRASNKAARAAEAAILAGDVDEAYRQKQAQLLNHALLAEAKAAADRVDKIVARLKKLAARAGMKSIDPEYLHKIHMLLEDYDFRPRSQRSIDEEQGFQEWLERQRAMGYEVHIPPRLENNGTPYTRVSVQELDSLSDLVESLMALGRMKQKLNVAGAERDFAEFRDEVVARIRQLPDRSAKKQRWWKSGKLVKNPPVNERGRMLAEASGELLKVETIVEELDGGPTGPLHDAIVLGATTAENKRFDLRARVLLPLAQAYHDMGRKQWKRLQERVTIPELTWNTLNEGDPRIGQPVTLTRMELLSVLMNMGNLSNLEKLSKGERWPVETLRAVMDREMTKADFDLAQKLWDQVGLLWPEIVATERTMAGVVPEQVVSSPIETKFGTYAGGYWPIVYDAARWQLAEDMEGKQLDDMFGIKSGVATQKGHTITRTGAFGPIQLSLESVLFKHIEQVVTRIAFSEYARNVMKIVRDRSIRGWIDTKLGPEYRKQVEKWLARQVHEGAVYAKAARWWDGLMRQSRINVTIAAMGFRFSTGIAQTLGLTASAQRIGAKWVGVGMKRLALDPRGMTRFVYDRSPELLHRTEAVNREVAEVARKMRGKHGALTTAQHWAMWHIGMMDRYTVALPTWLGAHAKGMAEGMTDEEASAYGDKSVRQSQGSGREKDLSAIQSPNSEAMRFFTMFYTPWNVMFNAQWQGVRGLKRGDVRPMIGVTFWWLTVSMLGDAMLSGDWPKDEKDPWDWASWAGRNFFFGLFAGIPLLRDGANFAESQIIGQFASDVGTTPITRIADAVAKAVKIGKKVKEGDPVDRPIKQAGDLTSVLLGVPLSQLGTTGQFAWDKAHKNTDPKTLSDWYFGITRDRKPAKDEEAAP